MRLIQTIGILLLMVIVTGCTEELRPVPYTYSQLLTGDTYKIWTVDSYTLQEEGQADLNYFIPDCLADDEFIFYADESRSFEVLNGREKCDPDDPDVLASGNWSAVNATATAEFIMPWLTPDPLPWTIEELDEDDLEVSFYLNDSKSIHVTFTLEDEGD